MGKRGYPEGSPEYLAAVAEELAEQQRAAASAEAMARIWRRKSTDDAKATLKRIEPLIHEIEMQKLLKARRLRIHAEAKRLLQKPGSEEQERQARLEKYVREADPADRSTLRRLLDKTIKR